MAELVSIVMPSLNQAAFLREAVASVLHQDYENLELIVADGASTDGTQEILTEIALRDSRLKWFSAPDNGPADALNKALAKARGTIIGWLNSDDCYTPGAIGRAVDAVLANPGWIMLYGQGEHVDAGGALVEPYPTRLPGPDSLQDFETGCFICQPTVFFKSTMKLLVGKLDESYKTAFDFDYWVRAFKKFPGRIGFVDAVQAQTRLHDDAITLKQRRQVCLESMRVVISHLGDPQPHWLISYANERREQNPGLGLEELRGELGAMIQELKPQPSEQGLALLHKAVERYC